MVAVSGPDGCTAVDLKVTAEKRPASSQSAPRSSSLKPAGGAGSAMERGSMLTSSVVAARFAGSSCILASNFVNSTVYCENDRWFSRAIRVECSGSSV